MSAMLTPVVPAKPSQAQATAALVGMYGALAERYPAARDQFILAAVRSKVTTDVVDNVGAATVTVSEVTSVSDATLAPGSAKYTATVTLVQDDGGAQVERHWFVLTTTPQGVRLVNTGQLEIVEYMPEDPQPPEPTAEAEPTSGGGEGPEDNYGLPFLEGVPCDGADTAQGCDARLKAGVDY